MCRAKRMVRIAALITCGLVSTAAGQTPVNPLARTLEDFTARVAAYVTLHKKLANETGALDVTKSPKEIAAREQALGLAIQKARAGATRGQVFAPAIARAFKELIADEYARRAPQVLRDRKEDQDELADFVPRVNRIYPPTQPLVTFPPDLLKVLPKLPEQLEYRLVQRYLILRDVEANLIVDVLPAATPR